MATPRSAETPQVRTTPRGRHAWTCPRCGRECRADAGYKARQQRPCLFCSREENGWQHQPACIGPDEHYGLCVTGPGESG